MVKNMDQGRSGRGRATWVHRPAPPGATWASPGPTKCHFGTLPHHRSVVAPPEAFSSVDLSRFTPIDEIELTRIHWPIVIHLEAPTDLGTTLSAKFHHVLVLVLLSVSRKLHKRTEVPL
jgi:hypothetical protein